MTKHILVTNDDGVLAPDRKRDDPQFETELLDTEEKFSLFGSG